MKIRANIQTITETTYEYDVPDEELLAYFNVDNFDHIEESDLISYLYHKDPGGTPTSDPEEDYRIVEAWT